MACKAHLEREKEKVRYKFDERKHTDRKFS